MSICMTINNEDVNMYKRVICYFKYYVIGQYVHNQLNYSQNELLVRKYDGIREMSTPDKQ